ncbi:thioredoxin fold domain-containing protein [candidate division KSB1 bacterium]|nr:thioredoxin fold domain-containing protein [candidate division KSB1 bacterium]
MKTGFFAGVLCFLALINCQSNTNHEKQTDITVRTERAKITFVELGSVKCIPCKAMQPVMESIEEKYGDQIEVIFYDVWQPDQKKYAQQYNIKLIPTQVFLDENGNEIMRHEGFFAEKKIDTFLQKQGLTPKEETSS